MIRGIDHVVLLASDLDTAARRFEAAGLGVIPGGRHPAWGTENALIPLADGAYLELLAAHDPHLAARHRLWSRPDGSLRAAGEFGGFALETDDIEGDSARAGELRMTRPEMGERHRPDGAVVRWRLSFTARPDFPFLIADVTPRSLRIPPTPVGLNARMQIAGVTVTVADLATSTRLYGALLAVPPRPVAHGRAAFATSRGRIVLHAPEETRSVLTPGLAATVLSVSGDSDIPQLTAVAGGAVLRVVREGDDAWTSF